MSGKYKLRKAIDIAQVVKQDNQEEIPAVLGLTIKGKKSVEIPTRPGYVYAQIRGNMSETVAAYNDQVSPVYGLHVLLTRDKVDKGRFRVKGRDLGKYQNWGSTSYLPKHGAQHSFNPDTPGGDIVWVWGKQFMPLMCVPSGSNGGPNVVVYGSPYNLDNEWLFAGDTGTINILPTFKPTGAWARMVLVFLDENGNPQVTGSATYFDTSLTGTSDITPYVPDIDTASYLPLAAIRLVSGTSIINWDNIYDFRPHYRLSMGGHIIQDDGVAQTQRDYLNFIGNGFVVYDDAGKTNVSGTAAGGVGAYTPNRVLYSDDAGIATTSRIFKFIDVNDDTTLLIGGDGDVKGFWDDYNLSLVTDTASGSWNEGLAIFGYTDSPRISTFQANGTEAFPELTVENDNLFYLTVYGYTSGSFPVNFPRWIPASLIYFNARENFYDDLVDTRAGTEIIINLWPTGTSSSMNEAVKLYNNQAWFYKDVVTQNGGSYYWGDPRVTGSWRSILANNRIEFQENIAGNWTTLGWSNTGSSNVHNLNDLDDVDTTGVVSGSLLGYDGTNWIDVGNGAWGGYIGDGVSTIITGSHGLGSTDVVVELWQVTGTYPLLANGDADKIELSTENDVVFTFPSAPPVDSYRAVVLKSCGGAALSSTNLDNYIYVDFTTTGTTTNGQDQDRTTASTYTTQSGILFIYNPIQITQVLWDIKNTGSYTLGIYSPRLLDTFAVFPAVYVGTATSADVVFTPTDPVTLMPGEYRFRMTADRAVTWNDNGDNPGLWNNEYDDFYIHHTLYDNAIQDSYSIPIKIVYYRGKMKIT